MALVIGDAGLGTGLAGELITEVIAELENLDDFDEATARNSLEPICNGVAKGLINYLKANMDLKLSGVTSGVDNVDVDAPGAVD